MTSSPETRDLDPPECPVCLQPYNIDDTIPRVLACGHSSCQVCLALLPRPPSLSSAVIRCPVCNQLVKFSDPTTLPKNIDLLRYSLSSSPKPHNPKPLIHYPPRHRFPPQVLSPELYARWKSWVLPQDAVLIDNQVGFGRIKIASDLSGILGCRLVEDQKVGVVEIGQFEAGESLFEYSYVSKVMGVLGCLSDGQRTKLSKLLGVSLRQPRVCGVLGLWLDVENGVLYLVSERKDDGTFNLGDLKDGFGQENEGWMSVLYMIGVDLSEAFVGLQSEGIVCGCLSLSCLCFDEFGHVYIDLGQVLVTGRKIYRCVLEGLNGKRKMEGSDVVELATDLLNKDVFISPQVLFELLHSDGIEVENNYVNRRVDHSSDVWLLACLLLRLITGKQFAQGMCKYWMAVLEVKRDGVADWKSVHVQWAETTKATLEAFIGSEYPSLEEVLLKCLDLDPANRSLITDAWKTIRVSNGSACTGHVSRLNRVSVKENDIHCLILEELCDISNDISKESTISRLNGGEDYPQAAHTQVREMKVSTVVEGLSAGKVQCKDLQGHLDCVTSLCIGGF